MKEKGILLHMIKHCKRIKGLRDRIVHGYETIDLDIIWETAKEDIQPLQDYCEKIIKDNS